MLILTVNCNNYSFRVDLSTGNEKKDEELSGRLDDFSDFVEECLNPVCLPEGSAKGQIWEIKMSTELAW